jgi:hypothetical protein
MTDELKVRKLRTITITYDSSFADVGEKDLEFAKLVQHIHSLGFTDVKVKYETEFIDESTAEETDEGWARAPEAMQIDVKKA